MMHEQGHEQKHGQVLILGIGNLLWADEGFGVRAVEEMHRCWVFPEHVRLVDGGTQGIYLVQMIRDADLLLVFDAVDYGLLPGTLRLVEGDAVPQFLGTRKMSLHQTGFQEVLAMAAMMGEAPTHQALIGVQPAMLEDFGGSLRPVVRTQIGPAVEQALQWLARHHVYATRRPQPLPPEQGIGSLEMRMEHYEYGRPDEQAAPRQGDARLLASVGWRGPGDFDAEMAALVMAPSHELRNRGRAG